MNFSPEQEAIFDWFKTGTGNLVIKARAGVGKTFTLTNAFQHAPEPRILYGVFNKRNQVEAEGKIKDHRVDVKTWHAVGYAAIRGAWRGVRPDAEVEADRLDQIENLAPWPIERGLVLKLVGFAKNTFINPTRDDMEELCAERDIEFEAIDGIALAMKCLEAAKVRDPLGRISFDDMVWLPVALNLVRPIYDFVAGDEAQDLSVPQLAMISRIAKGRIVVVGDDRQMIYSFRGCHPDGIAMMKSTLRAQELKLTTTFRCPHSVVSLAQEIVPDFNAHESNKQGEVLHVQDCDEAKPGDAILSRLNAPLMPLALSLLRRGVPARIEGRDIGRQLIGMVRSQKAKSVPHFFEKVSGWFEKQVKRIGKSKDADKKLSQSRDIRETLEAVAEGCKNVSEIEARITSLFHDSSEGLTPAVVLSSVHKAKGLEWKRVFLLTETFRRGKGIEEENIYYVAITRSMESLFLVNPKADKTLPSVNVESSKTPANDDIPAIETLPSVKVCKAATTAEILGFANAENL